MLETAKEHIEGRINIDEAQARIDSYYQTKEARHNQDSANTREADIVASRIAKLLGEATFNFSTFTYFNIHKKLFAGLYPHVGKIRPYNITKKEWVLFSDDRRELFSDYQRIQRQVAKAAKKVDRERNKDGGAGR